MESKGEVFMIPKIIHYCWVGNAPKPKSVLYCIESWKKFCPDYEIKEWNESNYDFSKNHYLFQITQDWILYINMVEFI